MKRLMVGICLATFAILSWQCSKAKDTIKQMEAALAEANQNTATSSDTLYVSQAVDSIVPSTSTATTASTSVSTVATTSVDTAGNTSVQVTTVSSSSSSGANIANSVTVTDMVTVTILSTDIQMETAPSRLEKIAELIYKQVPKKFTDSLTKLEFIGAMLKIRDMHHKHEKHDKDDDEKDDDNKKLSNQKLVKVVGCLSDQFAQFQNSNQLLSFTALEALLLANAPNIMEYRRYFFYHYGHHYEHNCGNLYSVFRELIDRESHYYAIPGLRNLSDSHQDDDWQSGYMGPGGWTPGHWNNGGVDTQTDVGACLPNLGASCKTDSDCNACVPVNGNSSLTLMTTVQCVSSKCQRTGCPILPPGAGMICTGCNPNQSCTTVPVGGSGGGSSGGNPQTNTNTNTGTVGGPVTPPTGVFTTNTKTLTSTTTCVSNINKSCKSSSDCNQCIKATTSNGSITVPATVDCINKACVQTQTNGCPYTPCPSNKQCTGCSPTAPCKCQ